MAAGVTQPGGAGTTIYIYDDASSASGTGYTFAEIAAAFPADFIDNGTYKPSYRSKVDVQVGDTGTGTATTTIGDVLGSVVSFDLNKGLLFRATQTTSWNTRFGVKTGSGETMGGKNGPTLYTNPQAYVGNIYIYGSDLRSTGGISFTCDNTAAEIAGNTITTALAMTFTGDSNMVVYNNLFPSTGTSGVLQLVANLTAMGGNVASATSPLFMLWPKAQLEIKDFVISANSATFGDIQANVGAGGGAAWRIIRPTYSGAANKFSTLGGLATDPDTAPQEMWIYNVKCVDGAGAGVSGLPVKLTDNEGNEPVDTTTDSSGRISFGSGLQANAVTVADHYLVGGVYTIRHRSPFLAEINMPDQAGYDGNYMSYKYYFDWPGKDSVTVSSGSFEDVNDVAQMSAIASGGSTWVERVVP